jgi:hypothetical protein
MLYSKVKVEKKHNIRLIENVAKFSSINSLNTHTWSEKKCQDKPHRSLNNRPVIN